jgi:hypothetical protein
MLWWQSCCQICTFSKLIHKNLRFSAPVESSIPRTQTRFSVKECLNLHFRPGRFGTLSNASPYPVTHYFSQGAIHGSLSDIQLKKSKSGPYSSMHHDPRRWWSPLSNHIKQSYFIAFSNITLIPGPLQRFVRTLCLRSWSRLSFQWDNRTRSCNYPWWMLMSYG